MPFGTKSYEKSDRLGRFLQGLAAGSQQVQLLQAQQAKKARETQMAQEAVAPLYNALQGTEVKKEIPVYGATPEGGALPSNTVTQKVYPSKDEMKKLEMSTFLNLLSQGTETAQKAADTYVKFRQFADEKVNKPIQPNLPEGFNSLTPQRKAETWNATYGTDYTAKDFEKPNPPSVDLSYKKAIADSKRNLSKAQKAITDFEANPKLMENYNKIVSNPEVQQALSTGNIDISSAIIAKLIGDTTPDKVLTRRYMDYIKAQNDEQGEFSYLKELGQDVKSLERKTEKKVDDPLGILK